MGYSKDLFTAPEIDPEFICSICYDVLKDPILLDPCEHTFCRLCISKWARGTCPVDRRPIEYQKTMSRPFMSLLRKLELRCPFTAAGCTVVLNLADFQGHEEECAHNPDNEETECENGCGAEVTQLERRQKLHNCVQYLARQLRTVKEELATEEMLKEEAEERADDLEEELEFIKAEMMDTKEMLKMNSEWRSKAEKIFQQLQSELEETKDQLVVSQRLLAKENCGTVLQLPEKRHRPLTLKYEPVQVTCVRKWNVSEEFQHLYQDMNAFVKEVAESTLKGASPGMLPCIKEELEAKILARVREKNSAGDAFHKWCVTVENLTDNNFGGNSDAAILYGMEFKINDRLLVRIRLKYY